MKSGTRLGGGVVSKMSGQQGGNEIVFYTTPHGAVHVEVMFEDETFWLSQKKMAELFAVDVRTINEHLTNVFSSNEVDENSVIRKFRITASDGKNYNTKFYNLDAIISVGYRVNSVRATQFRQWATKTLKDHIVKGYSLNESFLKSEAGKYRELRKAVDLLGNLAALESVPGETRGVAQVIAEYARALDLLDDYDYQRLKVPKGTKKETFNISLENARKVIDEMRKAYGGTSLMGREKDKGLQSTLGALYQTFDGKEMYPTVEEKAAHLLYFITKNHSFVDGNKRIAAALFICYLENNRLLMLKSGEPRIPNSTLAALTLLIAASKPSEKDMMIKIILNLMRA